MKTPFDIRKYLSSQDIHFKEEGENIGQGSIGICCPSCGDDNYHMGIDVDTKIYNCWKCEEQGNLASLIMLLEDVTLQSAFDRIKAGQTEKVIDRKNFFEQVQDILCKVVYGGEKVITKGQHEKKLEVPFTHHLHELDEQFIFDRMFLKFIKERNYSPEELAEWGIVAEVVGEYGYRLMFPITYEGEVVSYLGRTVSNDKTKYKNCSNDTAIIPMRKLLYGYDYITKGQDSLVICEGVFDTIRFGKGVAVGIFGKDMSVDQMALLCSLDIRKEIWIALDGEALYDADKIAKNLKPLVNAQVKILVLESGKDPDNYPREELLELIK
ncbi:hypothetical protein HN682_09755 [Candidatus Peregrinibacteria bacterium]|nr:hypothetical protein [Candidatus Peregrinibacteria bacterium]